MSCTDWASDIERFLYLCQATCQACLAYPCKRNTERLYCACDVLIHQNELARALELLLQAIVKVLGVPLLLCATVAFRYATTVYVLLAVMSLHNLASAHYNIAW